MVITTYFTFFFCFYFVVAVVVVVVCLSLEVLKHYHTRKLQNVVVKKLCVTEEIYDKSFMDYNQRF